MSLMISNRDNYTSLMKLAPNSPSLLANPNPNPNPNRTISGINFENTEKYYHEWLLVLEEHLPLPRSCFEIPLLPMIPTDVNNIINLQPSVLFENPKTTIPSIDNLNFLPQLVEADFEFWSCISTEFEDAWKAVPMMNDDYQVIPNNNYDETLNAVVEQGFKRSLKEGGSVNCGNEGELIDSSTNYYDDINNNNTPTKQIVKATSSKMEMLSYEEIRKHFEMPISEAAKRLKVGLTVLKKRCREFKIKRWPHRKIKSLNTLISNVKELGLREAAEALEESRRKLEAVPEMELTAETKRLRQACFKANYKLKKRRSLAG